jgi:hypothetical protein
MEAPAMNPNALTFNGLDADTGEYLLTLTPAEIVALWRKEAVDADHLVDLRERDRRTKQKVLAPMPGVDIGDLAQAGWGIVFPADGDPALEAALAALIDHRREQAGASKERRFKIFRGNDGYQKGETALDFLVRHGAGFGLADPDQMPYYLLLVGEPAQLPFSFQYQLDVQRGAGRIAFETVEEYASYADSVVAAEKALPRPRTAVFVGVQNPDDGATGLSATSLVAPLAVRIGEKCPTWQDGITTVIGTEANKARFAQVLGGAETPTFAFTASHGLGLRNDNPRQRTDQGALVCQDWPGPVAWKGKGKLPPDFYFAAADVADDANLGGMIAFHFACYGAGTPNEDDFAHLRLKKPVEIPAEPFVAALPRRMLGHPRGGALAVIGHVERAWGYSITWDGNPRLNQFVATVQLLLEGKPVGAALDAFNLLYAELATLLDEAKKSAQVGKKIDEQTITRLWTADNDARGYIVLGDPAVRLRVNEAPAPAGASPS